MGMWEIQLLLRNFRSKQITSLLYLVLKSLDELPVRIQRFRMRYQFLISHVAGKDLIMVDALSRALVYFGHSQGWPFPARSTGLPATDVRLSQIRELQRKMTYADRYAMDSWPDQSLLKGPVKPYSRRPITPSFSRIVVPGCLHLEMLERIYAGHIDGSHHSRIDTVQQSCWWVVGYEQYSRWFQYS